MASQAGMILATQGLLGLLSKEEFEG